MTTTATEETTTLAPKGLAQLPVEVTERGMNRSQWHTLFNLFPGAKPASVLLVWDYCKSRQLDPMKKPCHIVPIDVKANGQWQTRDVVMPGIYEYRITAQRTGLYLGHTEPEYGPELEFAGVKAPAWCAITFYRWNDKAREKVPYPVKVWFSEVVATNRDGNANARWTKAPIQMLTKCTEAAGLREAFPEEIGGEATAEEMDGRTIGDPSVTEEKPPVQQPQRRSAQGAAAEPAATATTETNPPAIVAGEVVGDDNGAREEAPKDAPAYIGTITALVEQNGAALVTLNTGFAAATKNAAFITALKKLREEGAVIELGTEASKKTPPAGAKPYAPNIVDITPIRDGEQA